MNDKDAYCVGCDQPSYSWGLTGGLCPTCDTALYHRQTKQDEFYAKAQAKLAEERLAAEQFWKGPRAPRPGSRHDFVVDDPFDQGPTAEDMKYVYDSLGVDPKPNK